VGGACVWRQNACVKMDYIEQKYVCVQNHILQKIRACTRTSIMSFYY